jgi:CheY-like chemotaxis protein
MPICDGVEAARRIRALEIQRKIKVSLPSKSKLYRIFDLTQRQKVVALSADAQESTKQLCLSTGFNAFFSKPLKKSECLSEIFRSKVQTLILLIIRRPFLLVVHVRYRSIVVEYDVRRARRVLT